MVIVNIHPEIDFLIVEKADKQAETTAWENVNKNSHGSDERSCRIIVKITAIKIDL